MIHSVPVILLSSVFLAEAVGGGDDVLVGHEGSAAKYGVVITGKVFFFMN